MNDKQKICLVVAITSMIIFSISVYVFNSFGHSIWWLKIDNYVGVLRGKRDLTAFQLNWVGMFSLATFFGSLCSLFLFKEKK